MFPPTAASLVAPFAKHFGGAGANCKIGGMLQPDRPGTLAGNRYATLNTCLQSSRYR
jgi:hypothetical protein